ncbi:immunoglobulin I-set domain protein [Ancylostoma duodenale]|uniref:Immunoglobulin I-set domain protein n=1 Tax=Ancylostoma duodenale TaxID=51022 RepID=A0A0C2DJW8_9BILA|nr:immunoglobulin I-set domain protein [Ancylostoma duodenale]
MPLFQVQILDVHSGFSHVLKENGMHGNVPSYFLELDDIPGDTLAEQISYRRMWHTLVDEVVPVEPSSSPLSPQRSPLLTAFVLDKRPVFVVPLTDVSVCEGDVVVLEPKISSVSSFTATWRGPAVQAGRAHLETDDGRPRLTIGKAGPLDGGPYSVVAENEYGSSSSLALVKVVIRPGKLSGNGSEAPTAVVCERIGRNALLLSWSQGARGGSYFCVEYKSEGY